MYGSSICTVDHSVAKFKVAAVAWQVAQILLKFFQIQDLPFAVCKIAKPNFAL